VSLSKDPSITFLGHQSAMLFEESLRLGDVSDIRFFRGIVRPSAVYLSWRARGLQLIRSISYSYPFCYGECHPLSRQD
jgi:hypothetical protein